MLDKTHTSTQGRVPEQPSAMRTSPLPAARAMLLGLVLIPLNVYWITVTEVRWYGTDGTSLPIFITPIFILLVLGLANLAVARLWPKQVLRQGELLIVYIMLTVSSALAGQDTLQNLFGAIGYAEHGASPFTGWRETWFRYLPKRLLIFDHQALDGFYRGGVSPWHWDILRYWLGPLALWSVMLGILLAMMLSINILLRRQWTEHEKLTFPLVQLPLAMTRDHDATAFYKNRILWLGFGIAVVIDLMNGLHALFPNVPYLLWVKKCDLGSMFTTRPWSALGVGGIGFHSTLFPFAIGMGYLIPLDLSFSCWFFFVARKLWQVFGASRGWDSQPGFPFCEEQAGGAWVALGMLAVWGCRRHLASVWRLAWSRRGLSDDDLAESRLCRRAIVTLGVGTVLIMAFCKLIGLSAWAGIGFFGLYFVLSIAMTRVRAELGTPHEIYFVNPARVMVAVLGTGALGAANLTVMSSLYWFNRCYRSHPMPGQLEALKMSDSAGIRTSQVIGAIVLASIAGMLAAYWANLQVTYSGGAEAKCLGAKNWTGYESYWGLTGWLSRNPAPDATRVSQVALGAAIVCALRIVRGAFIWWPFHPAGYALAVSFAMDVFWLPFLIAWAAKLLITRYGGMRLHNAALPAFLGLILGDFTMGALWSIVGAVAGVQTYKIWI